MSGYRLDERCLTDGCDGTPFFGETASPGYCDACHVERMTPDDDDPPARYWGEGEWSDGR